MRKTGLGWLDFDDVAARGALSRFHDDVSADVCARLPWLTAWRESHPQWRPAVLALMDADGWIRAVAPLAARRRVGLIRVVAFGHSGYDHSPIVHHTDADGTDLAAGVLDFLDGVGQPVVDLPGVRDVREVLSHNLRKADSRARNRLARTGRRFEQRWLSGGGRDRTADSRGPLCPARARPAAARLESAR